MTPAEERAWTLLLARIAALENSQIRVNEAIETARRERGASIREVEIRWEEKLQDFVVFSNAKFEKLDRETSAAGNFLVGWNSLIRVVVIGIGILAGGITVGNYVGNKTGDTGTTTTTTIQHEPNTATVITPPGTVTITVPSSRTGP